jgi:hypothetical protein
MAAGAMQLCHLTLHTTMRRWKGGSTTHLDDTFSRMWWPGWEQKQHQISDCRSGRGHPHPTLSHSLHRLLLFPLGAAGREDG